jgi:DNA mismatch repair protein MutS
MENNLTPMLRQYTELKKQYPGTLLFFRLGDFYELFFDDAIIGARELEITLTARNKEKGQPVPMCGVPYMAAPQYIARLVKRGFRVAVCEQMEEAGQKKLVRREVVRIVTPGTAIDPQLLEARESVYLAAICGTGECMGAAFLDLSTGAFYSTEVYGKNAWDQIRLEIEAYAPKELLFPASLSTLVRRSTNSPLPLNDTVSNLKEVTDSFGLPLSLTSIDDWQWVTEECTELLKNQFRVKSLDSYGLAGKFEAIRAAGACLRYAQETQREAAAHVSEISFIAPQDHLVLDSVTLRNLDILESNGSKKGKTLLSIIDRTVTGMGARLLRAWLTRPSIQQGEIGTRLDAVEDLVRSHIKRDTLRSTLKGIADLERLTGRLNMGNATARDLVSLRSSLDLVPSIQQLLLDFDSSLLQVLCGSADDLPELRELIERAIADEPPVNLSDGGTIRSGYSSELDELRGLSGDVKRTIASLEARERTRTGISSLKVRFNNVFGYFIEVSKSNASRVPTDYERRQTLANAERYTTRELKELETKVLGAEQRILELETTIFNEVRANAAEKTRRLQSTARAVAMIDALCSLAEVATQNRYTRPAVHGSDELQIVKGRHPIIEANGATFIPNDIYLNNSTDRLLIITGPNMAGKSSILRQTALICILAQIGSFVPADSAKLPILDRVWTRVGASDDLASGRSTFMVEMIETAAILHSASPRSLVLLDEIGRGTATFDGLSIAWAVAEYLHDSVEHSAKTLFATHYHELTELATKLPGAKNYQIAVAERENEIIFLYKLEPGRASKSYGIEVARLAGLPQKVLERAREVLAKLERYELEVIEDTTKNGTERSSGLERAAKTRAARAMAAQVSLFDVVNKSLLDELRSIDVEILSGEDARSMLLNLKDRIV